MAAAAISGDPIREPTERRERVLVVLIPLGFVAAAVLFVAAPQVARFVREGHVAALVALIAAVAATSAVRVGLLGLSGKLSFEFVIIVSAAILYGTAIAVVVAAVAALFVQLADRRPLIACSYNAMSGVLQAAAAGAVAGVLRDDGGPVDVIVATGAASVAWTLVNVTLICTAVVRSRSISPLPLLKQVGRELTVPALLMTSLIALIVVAWRESPLLATAAIGPIAAIALLQSRRIQVATANTMAVTDALTQIGNRRHFDDRLARELERATRLTLPFSICLLDIDDFKAINDTYGHAAGDGVLAAIASCLRRDGEAFRCGGDEFALLLPGFPEAEAAGAAAAVCGRIGDLTDPGGRPLAVSVGTATLSPTSPDPADLLRAADLALYRQKSERHQQSVPTRLTSRLAQ
jgi:diguanylate cyclase (GGDEF)-like protein